MDARRPSPPPGTKSVDHSALLATHAIPHSASEPAKSGSSSSGSGLHSTLAPEAGNQGPGPAKALDTSDAPSPPCISSTDHEAFSALRPTVSSERGAVTYTAAATARGRSLDQHGNFETEFDPNPKSSLVPSSTSPATLLKNLPDAATKTLNTTIAAPARTLDSIKSKLQSPSTERKSKSEIPNSLAQVERDMRNNQEQPGHVASEASNKSREEAKDGKSNSFSSFLGGGRSKRGNPISGLMQRGPGKSDASPRSSFVRSPRASTSHAPRRGKSTILEAEDEDDLEGNDLRDQEEEEDADMVRQRIKDQQKRLEELDEAQTVGLLRTQQEAGVEPPQSPTSPTAKPSWLVGLPLFGKDKQDDDDAAKGSSSRRSSFRRSRSRRRGEADESEAEDEARTEERVETPRRSKSEKLKGVAGRPQSRGRQSTGRSASASRAGRSRSRPRNGADDKPLSRRGSGVLGPPRRHSTTWTSKLRTKIPVKEFPLQGSGRESEFNQEEPLWARQPYKYMYFTYFGLSVGFFYLPRWALSSAFPSRRGRPDWSWKKATMVKLYRHGTQLTFRTRTSLGRDLQKEVPHSKTVRCKFTWVKPVADEDVRGELRRAMLAQKVHPQRTCGFWYGDVAEMAKMKKQHHHRHHHHRHRLHRHGHRHQNKGEEQPQNRSEDPLGDVSIPNTPPHEEVPALEALRSNSTGASVRENYPSADSGNLEEAIGGVGRAAEPGEKVLYHLHGGAYWIGTAHEKDVTAAVNTESLRYMAEIYKAREAEQEANSKDGPTINGNGTHGDSFSSGSTSASGSSAASSTSSPYKGKMLRSFSLDYRLCVPGRPKAGSYPAALLDALSGYLYLTRDLGFKSENIIIAGDSAGGNLALALCRYLRDEREVPAKMPGALLLMSPWVDVSRSHSGPTGAPNLDSTVYTNQNSDIISSMLAFRNTAVSAFLGDLPARETYRNPYISPVSLQLPLERGGSGPHYGFHGFPKKIYITSGSAEISYDQHMTLAHRLAAGTLKGRPIYSGDRLSAGCNAREMAERRNRPRPKEMLDADQNAISVTPMDELQGMDLHVDSNATEQSATQDEEQHVTKTIDGEPNPKPNTSQNIETEGASDTTTLLSSNSDKASSSPAKEKGKERLAASPPPEPEGKEDREVIFDEVKDAVHDYLLFKWFEPERSSTWRRIAQWIDEV